MIGDNSGQMSGEYLLLVGSIVIVLMLSVVFIAGEEELNVAMAAADNGANKGASVFQIYSEDSYDDYLKSKENLLGPYSVEIINVSYSQMGYDNVYDKHKIQFKVYATCSRDFSKKELDSIGDRINYNLRKSVAVSFNTSNSGNKLYNPVFSNHYVYTTANVKWV